MNTEKYLIEHGWKESYDPDKKRIYYKAFETPTRCGCNYDKDLQVICTPWKHRETESFELDICGELPNGTWIQFKLYSLPSELEEALTQIPILLAAWEAAAGAGNE